MIRHVDVVGFDLILDHNIAHPRQYPTTTTGYLAATLFNRPFVLRFIYFFVFIITNRQLGSIS